MGVRPTRGLVVVSGVGAEQPDAGRGRPIARTVTDARCSLVMVGYDAADPITAFGIGAHSESYTHLLNKAALKGARIGVMTNLFGEAERHREVNRVMDGVISRMESLGATVVLHPAGVRRSRRWSRRQRSKPARSWTGISQRSAPTHRSQELAQLVAAKSSAAQKTLEEELAAADGMNSQDYKNRMLNRDKLRLAVAAKMADLKLDAILYPLQKFFQCPSLRTIRS